MRRRVRHFLQSDLALAIVLAVAIAELLWMSKRFSRRTETTMPTTTKTKPCPYKTLKVKSDASKQAVQEAYRKLAARWHPDKNPGDAKAADRFREIKVAYDLLRDDERRARYDQTGDVGDDKPDNELGETLATIAPVLESVLLSATEKGGVGRVDVVARIRQALAGRVEQINQQLLAMQKAKDQLKAAADRFIPPDGEPNHLADLVRPHIRQVDEEIDRQQAQVAKLQKAIEFLTRQKFHTDANPGQWTSGDFFVRPNATNWTFGP